MIPVDPLSQYVFFLLFTVDENIFNVAIRVKSKTLSIGNYLFDTFYFIEQIKKKIAEWKIHLYYVRWDSNAAVEAHLRCFSFTSGSYSLSQVPDTQS
jgi:hypothetical protein